jgi:hypothetical protein
MSGLYDIPLPGKIRLKETKADKAARIHAKELRRFERAQQKINRANGFDVTPPRVHRDRSESLTPPRHVPQASSSRRSSDDDTFETGYKWMGNLAADAAEQLRRVEEQAKMDFMYQEEINLGNPWANSGWENGYSSTVPLRYRATSANAAGPSKRGVPDIGSMTEMEYASYIRVEMERAQNARELRQAAERRRMHDEMERLRYLSEERDREKEERRRLRREKRRRAEDQENIRREQEERQREADSNGGAMRWEAGGFVKHDRPSKQLARERYTHRWQVVVAVGGEIEECNMTYDDIPWPIYKGATLGKGAVEEFMKDLAAEKGQELKKTLRETIRAYHPDRFVGRILPRVRSQDQEDVRQGVEMCSRIINDLASSL